MPRLFPDPSLECALFRLRVSPLLYPCIGMRAFSFTCLSLYVSLRSIRDLALNCLSFVSSPFFFVSLLFPVSTHNYLLLRFRVCPLCCPAIKLHTFSFSCRSYFVPRFSCTVPSLFAVLRRLPLHLFRQCPYITKGNAATKPSSKGWRSK